MTDEQAEELKRNSEVAEAGNSYVAVMPFAILDLLADRAAAQAECERLRAIVAASPIYSTRAAAIAASDKPEGKP